MAWIPRCKICQFGWKICHNCGDIEFFLYRVVFYRCTLYIGLRRKALINTQVNSWQFIYFASAAVALDCVMSIIRFVDSCIRFRLSRFNPPASFYRAMPCIRGTSHGPVSVCVRPSVTSRCSIETNERIELVLACELPSTRPTLC